jgi:3-oxoadipate enol-lactonase
MKTLANGIAINCEISGTGPPLILIHALGLDHRMWRAQREALESRFEVIAYDVRGHGLSNKPDGPYSLEQMADDLHGLLAAWGVRRAYLLGLSLGGMVAQTFALDYPEIVESLILADTTSEYAPEARRAFEERARAVETHGIGPIVESTLERWFTPEYRLAEPAKVDEIRSTLSLADQFGYAAACRAVAGVDLTDRLGKLTMPALVIVGSEDPGTPPSAAERLRDAIPGARLEVISGASHLSNVSHAAEFNALVDGFLGG